jgi:hypothetical protein
MATIVRQGWKVGERALVLKTPDRQEALDYAETLEAKGYRVVIYFREGGVLTSDEYQVFA